MKLFGVSEKKWIHLPFFRQQLAQLAEFACPELQPLLFTDVLHQFRHWPAEGDQDKKL